MNRRLIINEEEKRRILNLHESRRSKELGFLFEADNAQVDGVYNNDKDYDYKKEGDNYFFKLKETPASPKAQAYKKQGKFANWTAATGAAKDAIAKLPFLSNLTAFQGPGDVDGSDEAFGPPQNEPTTSANTASVTTSAATPTTSAQTTTQTTTVAPIALRTDKEIRQDYRQAKQNVRQQNRQGRQDKRELERELKQLQNDLNSNLASKMGAKDKLDRMERIKQINAQLKTA